MEYLDVCGLSARDGAAFGKGLAALHLAKAPTNAAAAGAAGEAAGDGRGATNGFQEGGFGFPIEGCCGALEQPNAPVAGGGNWVDFWRERRLGHQLRVAKERYPEDRALQEAGARLSKSLREFFGGAGLRPEDIQPSLLHGDLWSGNVGICDGTPCIFDPAAYYGHHEADL